MNNYKYDIKGHCDNESITIAGQNDHDLSDITEISALKDLMQSKNTSGYFSFYVDNISLKTYSTWNFSKIPTKSY